MADSKRTLVNIVTIKSQYIYQEGQSGTSKKEIESENCETPGKKAKLDERQESEGKNYNKKYSRNSRHRGKDRNLACENLCKTLIDVPVNAPMPVCESLRCKYIHDINKFLQSKPPDIGDECHVFNLKGHCPRGISCRFNSKHITENGRNIVNETVRSNYEKNVPKTLNFYSKELENDLRRRTYNFSKSDKILDLIPKPRPPPPVPSFGHFNNSFWGPANEIDFTEDVDVPIPPPPKVDIIPPLVEESIGPCPDDDLFKAHLAEKKKIIWKDKLYLAPLAVFGNLPFRRVCKEFGVDVTCCEMVVATSILQSQSFEWLLTKKHETEDLFGVQILGSNPYSMTRCAQLFEEQTSIDFLELNVGMPDDTVMRAKSLSHMRREKIIETIVRCVSRVTSLPVTLFTRWGNYSDEKIAKRFLPNLKACEVSLITVHGRNKETKEVDWEYINTLAQKISPVSVFGLSDVFSCSDYFQIREKYPDVSGCVIGRGALVKPWIFTEIKQRRDWDISSSERFEMLRKFVNFGLEHWGSDTKGVELTRKFLLDWLSLLCRYIPLGLLEHPPQKMNDKSPKFVGRDDMETLLGSQRPSDWIKISEMLLGPYPQNYTFVPRIKENFWPVDS